MDDLEKYVQKNKEHTFNLDEYLAKNAPKPEGPKNQAAQATLERYGNVTTLGHLPQAQAASQKGLDQLFSNPLDPKDPVTVDTKLRAAGFQIEQPGDTYLSRRDENIQRQERLAQEYPKATALGTGLGIAGSTLIGSRLLPMGTGPTAAARVGQSAKTGATYGLLQNPGDTEGKIEPLQAYDRLKGGLVGGAVGAGSSAVLEGASPLAKWASKKLRGSAEESAFSAMGPDFRSARQNLEKGQVNEVGGRLLDEGVVRGRPTSFKGLANRANAAKESTGKQLDEVLERLSEIEKQSPQGPSIQREAIAKKMREELINPNTELPGIAAKNAKIETLITQFEKGGDATIPLLRSEGLKRSVGKEINWDRMPGTDIPLEEQVQLSLYRKLADATESTAENLDKARAGADAKSFTELKKSFGALDTATKMAKKRDARDVANRFLSPTDYFAGGVGASIGFSQGDSVEDRLKNAAIGASLGGLNKAGRTYLPQLNAAAMNQSSKILAKAPALAAAVEQNPALINRITSVISGGPVNRKAERDDTLDDPEIRLIFEKNPDLINMVQDPMRRKLIQAKLRGPAGN